MRLVWALIPLVLIVMMTLFPTQNALACSCVRTSPIEKYGNSDYIFVGTVIHIEDSTYHHLSNENYDWDTQLSTFEIKSKWKGDLNSTVIIETDNFSSCSYGFQNNTTYRVFAYETDAEYLGTGSCSGNQKVSGEYDPNLIIDIILYSILFYIFSMWGILIILTLAILIAIIVIRKKLVNKRKKEKP